MDRQRDLIKNTFLFAASKISTQFLTLLLIPLYTTQLSRSEVGYIDLVVTYVVLLSPIISLQLESAVFRFLIDARNNPKKQKIIIANTFQLIGKLLLIFLVIYLAIASIVTIRHGILLFAVIVVNVPLNVCLLIARGLGKNLYFAIATIISSATSVLLNIVFLMVFHMGTAGILLAILISATLSFLYLFVSLQLSPYLSLSLKNGAYKKELLGYSLPLIPNGISWWLISAADRTLIALFLGSASNGIYAIAYKFPMIFSGLFSFFGMSWTESASLHINSKDRDDYFSNTVNSSIVFFGCLGAGIIAITPYLFVLLVNSNFYTAFNYVPIMIVGAFFNTIIGLYGAIYTSLKMSRKVATTTAVSAALSIGFTLVFIRYFGIYAAAFSMSIAYLVMVIFRFIDLKKYINLHYHKFNLLVLAMLYLSTIVLYYQHNSLTSILNVIIVTIVSILLNRKLFGPLASVIDRQWAKIKKVIG